MIERKKEEAGSVFPSPLTLLYTAYSDEHPVVSHAMEKGFQKIDEFMVSLSEQERNTLLQAFYEIYTENESLAFKTGVRVGVRLAKELL